MLIPSISLSAPYITTHFQLKNLDFADMIIIKKVEKPS